MYPSSTPLVPDDQYHERDFAPGDLDAERDLQRMRRPQRQTAMKKPSLANRMVRSVSRFFAAVLIGVALTLAGQSYSEQLNEMIAGWAPSLASLLPVQSSKQTAEGAASSELAQQIKLIAVDLAIVRRSVGQLAANQDQFAAKQEQMNQNIATLQQAEQEIRQQILAPPAPKAAHPPAPAAHNPPQPPPR
jgi:septal ring factor EnvC (AmiA/AmiB activator)